MSEPDDEIVLKGTISKEIFTCTSELPGATLVLTVDMSIDDAFESAEILVESAERGIRATIDKILEEQQ